MNFSHDDYPSFYRNNDRFSLEGQQTYLKWIKIELTVLVIAAVIGLFPFDSPSYGQALAVFSVIAFSAGIAITFFIKNSKFEDDWYIGRALAESIKSLTWKYMTGGEPFGSDMTIEEADKKFINILKDILDDNRGFLKVTYKDDDGVNITSKMREIRLSSFQQRKDIYINDRVKDQQKWYKSKSSFNKEKTSRLFWLIIFLQSLALIYSLFLVVNTNLFNVVPLLTTLAAVILSWLQVKQYQELSQSYAVAANDIDLILAQEPYIDSEKKLEIFVADSENAFSREHTLWIARRDVLTYRN